MNAEIIAVGSELLLGQIANTNAAYLSKELAELGINVYFHTVVGDNENRLKNAIKNAQTRSNLIIFTGGLGPTKDDLTKEAVAEILAKQLVYDEQSLEAIEQFFQRLKKPMPENNKKQALVIEGADVLPNEAGLAPGMALKVDGILYMLFPGPPRELYHMFDKYGNPYLQKELDEKVIIRSKVLRFFGIGESQLETDLLDILSTQTNPTIAPLAGDGEVTLRITAKHHDEQEIERMIDAVEQRILERVGSYFYGYNRDTLSSVVFDKLREKNLTIASAESLTGGLFASQLTSYSGASAVLKGSVVCYTDKVKQMIGVSEKTLAAYGAVSKECALELADKIRTMMDTDIGISFTGVAGPTPSENKPVGTVYIGISLKDGESTCFELALSGQRGSIQRNSVKNGFFHLLKLLNEK